jgi:hypothetical protein
VAPGERTDTIAFDINDRGDIMILQGTLYRLPEIACGRPTVLTSPSTAPAPAPMAMDRETEDQVGIEVS